MKNIIANLMARFGIQPVSEVQEAAVSYRNLLTINTKDGGNLKVWHDDWDPANENKVSEHWDDFIKWYMNGDTASYFLTSKTLEQWFAGKILGHSISRWRK